MLNEDYIVDIDLSQNGDGVIVSSVTLNVQNVVDVDSWLSGAPGPAGEGVPTGGIANQVLQKTSSVNFEADWHTLVKADVGLTNVDNTSDANKPVSTAQQTALNLKADKSTTISAGTGMTGGGDLSANRTLTLANTAVTPGSYTNASVTVDAQGRLIAASSGSGVGNVVGPSSATDNAIARYDGTTGKIIQDSQASIDDLGNMSIAGVLYSLGIATDIIAPLSGSTVAFRNTGGLDGSIDMSGNTSNRVYTFPDATTNIMGDNTTNTVTNKNLTSGTNTFPTFNQNTTGSAATLTTGRTFQTNLASTTAVSFNGSANNSHGVTGTLPLGNGGTGATTASAARTSLGLVIGTNVQAWDTDLDTWATKTAPSGTVVGTTDTQTQTNKRITKRTDSTTSSATPTINTDKVDEYDITALTANITSMTTNLSGTPDNGDELMLRFKDNGTARTISWGASFVSSGVAALLATTVTSKTHYVLLRYNSTAAKWVCMAVDAIGY